MENYLRKIEYDKILDNLQNFAITSFAKEKILNLKPAFEKELVIFLLNETSESLSFILRKGLPPIFEIDDISLSIKKLESGNYLTIKELLNIANILKLANTLNKYFFDDKNIDLSEYKILNNYFNALYSNMDIQNKIFKAIIDEENIADNASNKLSSLRKNRKNLEVKIKETLNNMIHSSTYSKCIMEQIITIKNDRYVIPVKEEYRGMIKGFVHDISQSGSTLFIEPMSVFEMNNSINNIRFEEALEIENILKELSISIYPIIENLKTNIENITNIDFAFSKAKFSKSYLGNIPIINDEKTIILNKAKHPLIDENTVVPIDISIGKNYSILVITGPNTGGKTVSLKTTSLLLAMAYSGLSIPANSDSSIYVFDNIFVDIGDEQSIQESLSTFSGHMKKIINITKKATENSIIFLDELCSGTDPIEGANLATAILEFFYNTGCTCLVTTHYQEIKNYALVTNGFENASCEFNVETLSPTYKLLIGIPGKSNAFAISKKLGLNEEILNNAKNLMNDDHINIEELLKSIYDNKLLIEKQKEETIKNLNQIELLRKSLEKENLIKQEEEKNIIEKAKEKSKDILLSSKDEANDIINKINEIYSKFKILKDIDLDSISDKDLAILIRNNLDFNDISKINKLNQTLNTKIKEISSSNLNNIDEKVSNINIKDLKKGMNVKLNTTSETAIIESISNKSIRVKIGNATMNIKPNNIVKILDDKKEVLSSKKTSFNTIKSRNISPEINVIGQTVDEACFVIDKYLDDCYLSKLENIRIVHGKGTGALRKGIHNFLSSHPHVKSYRLGTFGEGEMGVTIVELK